MHVAGSAKFGPWPQHDTEERGIGFGDQCVAPVEHTEAPPQCADEKRGEIRHAADQTAFTPARTAYSVDGNAMALLAAGRAGVARMAGDDRDVPTLRGQSLREISE
ncbi:MAG: hypothetical protein BWX86_00848 [Verrucomicrobia bacterium ADurb.Bin122]|nr:MAG: hypothetical protein BWX86_00848 [Verrucomicrobia bacterium ADurb.Bin122]